MEEILTYYDEKAKNYDATYGILCFKVLDAITWKYLEPYLTTNANAFVLDAGGGTGHWAIQMARKGCNVVLADASEEMLKIAAEKIRKEKLQHRINVEKSDITKTPHPSKSFDMIFCEQTFFLFKSPDTLIREMARVLKKGARLVISAQNRYVQCLASLSENPNSENLDKALNLLHCKEYSTMTKSGSVKIYTWTLDEFRMILERNGFHIEKIVGKGITMPLRISKETFMRQDYPEDLLEKILEFEFALCEKPDALSLAGHLQAIARKL